MHTKYRHLSVASILTFLRGCGICGYSEVQEVSLGPLKGQFVEGDWFVYIWIASAKAKKNRSDDNSKKRPLFIKKSYDLVKRIRKESIPHK